MFIYDVIVTDSAARVVRIADIACTFGKTYMWVIQVCVRTMNISVSVAKGIIFTHLRDGILIGF